jgi:UDP-N-acetylglucosamine 2-epimerase (non-hydrolysing)
MIDSLLLHIDQARQAAPLNGHRPGEYAVVTLHRPSNVDNRAILLGILDAIQKLSERIPVLLPAHPRTVKNITQFGLLPRLKSNQRLRLMEPLSYLRFVGLVAQARMVLTDSGGIQEETTVLGVPCLTMRDNTERPITCEVGTNRLVGTNPALILQAALQILECPAPKISVPEKWDGHAAERIVNVLLPMARVAVASDRSS